MQDLQLRTVMHWQVCKHPNITSVRSTFTRSRHYGTDALQLLGLHTSANSGTSIGMPCNNHHQEKTTHCNWKRVARFIHLVHGVSSTCQQGSMPSKHGKQNGCKANEGCWFNEGWHERSRFPWGCKHALNWKVKSSIGHDCSAYQLCELAAFGMQKIPNSNKPKQQIMLIMLEMNGLSTYPCCCLC